MQASPVRIIEYFNGTKQSVIPLFQRPYTWSKENWSVLWDDIMSHYGIAGSTHFMGAVVSFPVVMVPVGVTKHLVIDGQQRLTTIAILLAALRDLADLRTADRINDYLTNRHYDGLEKLKLLPTHEDRKAYSDLVLGSFINVESLICAAYQYFSQKIKGSHEGRTIDPLKVLEAVEHSLQVVMINLGDTDDPYLIFESLNAKGEPLTEADLVRNYVLMKFRHSLEEGGEQERIYQRYWQPLERSVGLSLPIFLRHYCMKNGSVIDKRAVYSAIKGLLSTFTDDESIEAELKHMARLGDFYSRFLDPNNENDSEVSASLAAFVELDVTTCYPLLLRLFNSRDREAISDKQFKQCLLLIESFVVRRAVCDVPTNTLNRLFVQWSGDYREEDVVNWLKERMAAGDNNTRWPSDTAFKESFQSSRQYGRKATKYVLSALEKSFAHREPASLKSTTIEHVMPQTLSLEWEQALGENAHDIHQSLLHTFGNLTLTGYNPELSNLPFSAKRKLLADSHIELNCWIAKQPDWNRSTIEHRAAELAGLAAKLWIGPESVV